MKDSKSLAWLLPAASLLILVGWFLGRQGWSVAKLNPPGIELVPPTATLQTQPNQPNSYFTSYACLLAANIDSSAVGIRNIVYSTS